MKFEGQLNLENGELTSETVYRSEFDGVEDSLNVFLQSVEDLTYEINQKNKQQYVNLYRESYDKELAREKWAAALCQP